jgi:hypothetical protein
MEHEIKEMRREKVCDGHPTVKVLQSLITI